MRIGWYIHHHGAGHLHRFMALRGAIHGVTVLSSLPRPIEVPTDEWVNLPLDIPAATGHDPVAGGTLHWAPLRHEGLRDRMAQIANWIQRTRPDALVIDVSVEVALLARLHGVPVIWIAQRGRRTDPPHRTAYAAASLIIAPWTAATQHDEIGPPPPHASFVGAISRFDDRAPTPAREQRRVLLLAGGGGHEIDAHKLRQVIRCTHRWKWTTLGLEGSAGDIESRTAADRNRVWAQLAAADVVVAAAGANAIAETAAARRPLICLPQPRPFDEQLCAARSLEKSGLIESCERWPATRRWNELLERALDRDPERWELLHDRYARDRIAQQITEVACA